jgi:hypothetical protein
LGSPQFNGALVAILTCIPKYTIWNTLMKHRVHFKGASAARQALQIGELIRRVSGQTRIVCAFVFSLSGALVVSSPLAAQASIPRPHPFPPGAAVYEWHYSCPHRNPDGTCRFSIMAANYSANNVADAQIVLAFQPVGSQQIPFYYFWITSMAKKKPDLVMLQSPTPVFRLSRKA